MENKRIKRIEALLRETVSKALQEKLENLHLMIVSINRVKLTNDFQEAKIYYNVYGGALERKKADRVIKKNISFIRYKVAQETNLKYMPKLNFFYDQSIEKTERILNLLKDLRK